MSLRLFACLALVFTGLAAPRASALERGLDLERGSVSGEDTADAPAAAAITPSLPCEVIISVPEQRLLVVRNGMWQERYSVSTSRFGVGDSFGSYKTPSGRFRVCHKIGGDLPHGAVLKHRAATGEIVHANARGRDPIVTRILWLDGVEAKNAHARGRGIYIHGTPEESRIGEPVSWGCVRMRSRDIEEVFDAVDVGTPVRIVEERLPKLKKWTPSKPVLIAKQERKPAVEESAAAARQPPKPEKAAGALSKISFPSASSSETLEVAPAKRGPLVATNSDRTRTLKGSILFHDLEN